jgi:hypothetical protein
MSIPMVYPDSPNVRKTDPLTSHQAADSAVKRRQTMLAVNRALQAADGTPMTSWTIWEMTRLYGFWCSPERVRTVLAEGRRDGHYERTEGGLSPYGRACGLWALKETNA